MHLVHYHNNIITIIFFLILAAAGLYLSPPARTSQATVQEKPIHTTVTDNY